MRKKTTKTPVVVTKKRKTRKAVNGDKGLEDKIREDLSRAWAGKIERAPKGRKR
jgi:hypothetical protein